MTRDDDRKSTLAAALDRIRWDYSPAKDRRFLLAPLSRIFEAIAWDSRPRPDKSATVQKDSKLTEESDES
jgi:hypothetical protein